MADEKLNTGSGEEKLPEAPAPVAADEPQAPAPEQTAAPTPQQEGPAQPEPGDVVVSFDKINELMNEKRQTARAEVLVCVAIYAVLIQGIATGGDPIGAIWGTVGYTVLLCFMLFKTGGIAQRIFGAH